MATKPRLDPHDGWHHVMNRGGCRRIIFHDDEDRLRFLQMLCESAESEKIQIVAYCLMGNHFHLILSCPEGGLSKMMQRLASRYVRWFNRKHGRDGPLFRGRFKSVLIRSNAQLVTAVRYVHRNPLEIGQSLSSYQWSSYATYIAARARERWLTPDLPLDLVGGPKACKLHTECELEPQLAAVDADQVDVAEPSAPSNKARLNAIARIVGDRGGVTVQSIKARHAFGALEPRLVAIWLASQEVPHDAVGNFFNLSNTQELHRAVQELERRAERPGPCRTLLESAHAEILKQHVTRRWRYAS